MDLCPAAKFRFGSEAKRRLSRKRYAASSTSGAAPLRDSGRLQAHDEFMLARYDLRPDALGWTVYDIWTGWPAVIRGAEQVGLDVEDADDLVDLLNRMNDKRLPLP